MQQTKQDKSGLSEEEHTSLKEFYGKHSYAYKGPLNDLREIILLLRPHEILLTNNPKNGFDVESELLRMKTVHKDEPINGKALKHKEGESISYHGEVVLIDGKTKKEVKAALKRSLTDQGFNSAEVPELEALRAAIATAVTKHHGASSIMLTKDEEKSIVDAAIKVAPKGLAR